MLQLNAAGFRYNPSGPGVVCCPFRILALALAIEAPCLGRPADIGGEILDAPDVILLRLLSKMAGRPIVHQSPAKRAGTPTPTPSRVERTAPFSSEPLACRNTSQTARDRV